MAMPVLVMVLIEITVQQAVPNMTGKSITNR
jgi:hypothetical protein